jgi:excisionase family DNA binding protein
LALVTRDARQQSERERTPTESYPPKLRTGLLTLRQVAGFLGVSEKTVRRLVTAGKLHYIRVGRVLRFQPADLFRFVEARKE